MYSVPYLEHYADRYVELHLKGHGISLEQYLANPQRYEHLADEPFPLLPEQRQAQARIDAAEVPVPVEAEVDHLPRRNGTVVEILHHHRHPRRKPSGMPGWSRT